MRAAVRIVAGRAGAARVSLDILHVAQRIGVDPVGAAASLREAITVTDRTVPDLRAELPADPARPPSKQARGKSSPPSVMKATPGHHYRVLPVFSAPRLAVRWSMVGTVGP